LLGSDDDAHDPETTPVLRTLEEMQLALRNIAICFSRGVPLRHPPPWLLADQAVEASNVCSRYSQTPLECDDLIRKAYGPGAIRSRGNSWVFSPVFATLAAEAANLVAANQQRWARQDEERRRAVEQERTRERQRQFPGCVNECLKAAGWNTRDHCEAVCR
jgi:hypothetical protein